MSSQIPTLRTAHETAPLVRRSASWLYRKARAGLIPCTRFGVNVFWTDEQIARIIRDGAVEPKPAQPKRPVKKQPAPVPQQPAPRGRPRLAPANRANVPKADRSVSRLYRLEDAS